MPHSDRLPSWLPRWRSDCVSSLMRGSPDARPLNSFAATANRTDASDGYRCLRLCGRACCRRRQLNSSADNAAGGHLFAVFVDRLFVALFDVQLLERGVRGGLLRGTLGVAAATRVDLGTSLDLDHEHRRVTWAGVVDQVVHGSRLEPRLRDLLQARLCVDHALRTEARLDLLVDQWQQHLPRRVQTPVQVDRADNRLEAARQQRRP